MQDSIVYSTVSKKNKIIIKMMQDFRKIKKA